MEVYWTTRGHVLVGKLIFAQLVKEFPSFCATRRFINVIIRFFYTKLHGRVISILLCIQKALASHLHSDTVYID
jgi:hypothetical protein